ncbi:MAG: hypothetical protein HY901_06495 [Deltaproteobacteria bacterium]|nr:hypothetical protein [Deltaproteobacteria bacterium]
MKMALESGETILKEGAANLQRGAETVGGHLCLTEHRLVFESHRFNLQTGSTVIPLGEITVTRPCWTKFLNLIPLAPNSLAVSTAGGQEHKFVLYGRMAWRKSIDEARLRRP